MWGSNEQQNQSLQHEMIGTISIHSRQGSKKHKSVCDELWDYGEDDEVIRSRAVNEKNINNVPEEIRSMREHPEPIPHEESAEYSSHLAFSQFHHDENQSQPNSSKTLHKPKCPPNQNFLKLSQKQNIGTSPFSKHQINVHNPSATRTIDILTHRYISNMKLLTQQTKQLLAMWKYCIVENQREYYRKQLGKLESSCRKLRIGLRGLGDRKKKGIISYSKEKKLKTEYQEERKIGAEIIKQKKKNNQLSVRQSLLNNYYHAIKTRSFPRTPLKSNTKLKNTISFVEEDEVKIKQHCQLLKEKKKILQESLIESKAHIRKKYEQTLSENQLLQEEIQMIEGKIKRMPYNKEFTSIYTNRLLGRQDRTGMNAKSISKSSKKNQVRGQLSQTKRRYEGIKKTCISPRAKIGVEGQKQKKSQLTKVKSETYIVMDHENTRENYLIISNI